MLLPAVRRKKTGFHQACCILCPLGPTLPVRGPPLPHVCLRHPLTRLIRGSRSRPVARCHLSRPAGLAGSSVVATVAAFGGRIGRDSYAAPALDSWMTPLFRGPPPDHLSFSGASWPRRTLGLFPAVVPQTTVSACEVSPAAEFYPSLQLGNHAPWPTPPLVCGVEVDCWPPERSGAARPTSRTAYDALTAVLPCPHSPLALVKPPKSSLRTGNHQAAGVGSLFLIHAASSPVAATAPSMIRCSGV
jgi:hypothetical protein